MTSKQTKIIIIASLAIVLIAAGWFYYNKQQNSTLSHVENNANISENDENKSNSNESSESVGKSSINSGDGTSVQITHSAEFDTAMKNGSKAFQAGNYTQAIKYYNEALSYRDSDVVYARLFSIYLAQNNTSKAKAAIDAAIKLNPAYTDYWNSKIGLLDEKTNSSYQDLKNVYNEGLSKVNPKTKINLITYFATIAESNGEISDSISLWQYAQNLYPENRSVYQAEIDRLKLK
jgi:tetratricopeptide (TPR) repeat protein